jgi:hypothetical protein
VKLLFEAELFLVIGDVGGIHGVAHAPILCAIDWRAWVPCFHLAMKVKWHFTLQLFVERVKDFTSLIGREWKFVCCAFTLKINNHQMIPFKISTWQRFLHFLGPKVWLVKEILSEIRLEIQTFFKGTNFFFPKPILFHNSCIFLDFYLILLREICLRFIWSNDYSVKCPYIALHQCMYQFHLLHYTK